MLLLRCYLIDCWVSELSKVKDKSLIHYIRQNIVSENLIKLYESFYDPSTISQRPVPPQGDNTYTYTDTNTYIHTDKERDSSIDINTNIESDINIMDTNVDTNIDAVMDININTNENKNADTKVDLNIAKENGTRKDTVIVKAQPIGKNTISKNDDAHSLSISLVQEYEKLTGHIGTVNLGAVKLAVMKHGYCNVQKAMAKALEKGKLSMSYVNGILKTWAKEGYPKEGENNGTRSIKKDKRVDRDELQGFKTQPPRTLSEEERRSMEKELL